jgi:DNA-binding NtrC family response regulator
MSIFMDNRLPDIVEVPPTMGSTRILLVEDDISLRSALRKYLGVQFEMDTTGDLAGARSALFGNYFDVVLLDKGLPDGDGITLIPEIKGKSPETAVVIMTGDAEFNSALKCISAGADDYVLKSDNIVPELFVRVPVAIDHARLKVRSLVGLAPDMKLPWTRAEATKEAYLSFMERAEKAFISSALKLFDGDAVQTATAIGLAKSTIFKKIAELGISRKSLERESSINGYSRV